MTATLPSAPPLRPHLRAYETGSFVRPVQRLVWEPVPVPALPADGAGLAGRRLWLLGADAALREDVAARLRDLGATVGSGPAAPGPPADVDGIVDLNVVGLPYRLDADDWSAPLAETTAAVQHVYEDWAHDPRTDERAYVVVTALGGAMGYDPDRDVPQPLGGVWAGLAKGLLRELPNLAMKIVDVPVADAAGVAAAVAAEYGRWDFFEVGAVPGTRLALGAVTRPTPPPRWEPTAEDLVLVSGGARGVGFAVVRHLAERHGCRVVVTGRKPLPTGADRARLLDDAAYAGWVAAQRADVGSAAAVRAARARLAQAENDRLVLLNLAGAERDGLRVEYAACDVSDADAVTALVRRLAPGPTVVIHNAGIDEPKRFGAKSADIVRRTVDVKVAGFAALVRALAATEGERRPLRMFCNVGSLAGRMGGMVGQADYAAGNEGLARLGFWARRHAGLPVQTLCWPTWERLGIIANYEAAVRYVSTLDPDEGVRRWLAELTAAHQDEVVFLGTVGGALVPSQLRGFRLFAGHDDLVRLHALNHHLGTVRTFVPFASLRTEHHYAAGDHPCLSDVEVDGGPVVPVGVAVELMLAAVDWVVPDGWPLLDLVEVRDLVVRPGALGLGDPAGLTLTREASGAWSGDRWEVAVRLRRQGEAEPVATAVAVLAPAGTAPDLHAPTPDPTPSRSAAPAPAGPHWRGRAIPPPRWTDTDDGRECEVVAVSPADLWTTTFPPATTVAPAALEALVTGPDLRVAALALRPGAQSVTRLRAAGDTVVGTTADGTVVLVARGVAR